jgi:hypothetical protein
MSQQMLLGKSILPDDVWRTLFYRINVHPWDNHMDSIEAITGMLYLQGIIPRTVQDDALMLMDELSTEIRINLSAF